MYTFVYICTHSYICTYKFLLPTNEKSFLLRNRKSYAGAPDNPPCCCTSGRNCMRQSFPKQPQYSLKRSVYMVSDKAVCSDALYITRIVIGRMEFTDETA